MEKDILAHIPHKADVIKNMPEAQSLIRMLSEQNETLMQNVMKALQSGDYTKARQLLQSSKGSDEIQDTLRKLGQKLG